MRLSAPLCRLKRKARLLSRRENIPLNQALNRIAAEEGFPTWSLVAAKASAVSPAGKLYARLSPGDLVLVGARPGQGKTLMSLELAVEAMKGGKRAVFFTLEYTEGTFWTGSAPSGRNGRSSRDCSNWIVRTRSGPTTLWGS